MFSFLKNLFKSEPKPTAATTIWAPPPAPPAQTEPTVTQKQDVVNEQLVKAVKDLNTIEQAVEAQVAKIKTRKPRVKKPD